MLEVNDLTIGVEHSPLSLLREVSFTVEAGQIMGLVGESGSGKTMASLAIMGILPPGIEFREGSVAVDGRALVAADGVVRRTAEEMAMIFQHPRSALNPTMRVGRQISRVIRINQGVPAEEAQQRAVQMLAHVGIPGAQRVAKAYPHQLSGGMCQRVMIAMALSCRPKVLIADEATTALDVTIQAQIFDLIRDLVAETQAAVVFITHDLAAVAEMCDRVTVMYGGQVMETGDTRSVLTNPQHPYTRFLLDAIEREVDPRVEEKGVNFALSGCRFAHRCPYAFEACREFPPMVRVGDSHYASCFLHAEERSSSVTA
ncbi:MAG: ABC transporter ATP-binding protein [Acidimicrobiia bacterium]